MIRPLESPRLWRQSNILRFAILLGVGFVGCGRQPPIDTTHFFSDANWEQAIAKQYPQRKFESKDRRYKMSRRSFLETQLARALLARNVDMTAASNLSEAEFMALNELIAINLTGEKPFDLTPDEIERLRIGIEKRNDGHLNLKIERDGKTEGRSTAAIWAAAKE